MPLTKHTEKLDPKNAAFMMAATAPYNFISLPQQFRPGNQGKADHSLFAPRLLSGVIDLTVTALTELFVRGTHTIEEYGSKNAGGHANAQREFFQPAEMGRIPGSTLRGLARNMVETLSESRLTDITDAPMFYRTFDGSSLNDDYLAKMQAGYGVRGGYLKREGREYALYPAPLYRIDMKHIPAGMDRVWDRQEVWFAQPASAGDDVTQCKLVSSTPTAPADWEKGWVIASGNIEKKKRQWLVGPEDGPPLDVPSEAIRSALALYRQGGVPVPPERNPPYPPYPSLSLLNRDFVPCCFQMVDGALCLGHTGMFRLPYKKTPAQIVKDYYWPRSKKASEIDAPGLAESIFGVSAAETNGHAGFVYFEDAFLISGNFSANEKQPKVLGSPHPTTYPHYVCQAQTIQEGMKKGNPTGLIDKHNLTHWDKPGAAPRGTKIYWHCKEKVWEEAPGEPTSSHPAPIKPAFEGTVFQGRIRFDNLSPVQLGCLLSALQLEAGRAHKLGMGKPLGLGSVRLECALNLIDRQKRYEQIFDDEGDAWHTAAAAATDEDFRGYQDAFAQWMLTGDANLDTLWQQSRMKELDAMLNTKKIEREKIEYLKGPDPQNKQIGDFPDKRILPGPIQVFRDKAKQ